MVLKTQGRFGSVPAKEGANQRGAHREEEPKRREEKRERQGSRGNVRKERQEMGRGGEGAGGALRQRLGDSPTPCLEKPSELWALGGASLPARFLAI